MTALAYAVGVLLFAVGVALSIGLHEAGHLIPGKLFDVKVTQYFIGFGRTLFSFRRGETEYGLKAVPLGGYCKLVGMVPPEADGGTATGSDVVRSRNTGMFAQLVSDVKRAEYEHVDPHDHDRLFYTKPWWQRVIIMGSGVAINLVLSFLLFAFAFMVHGAQVATTTVDSVSQCVIAVTKANLDQPPRKCTAADPAAPALTAGVRQGDRILAINGHVTTSWDGVTRAIRSNGARAATLLVERDGHRMTLHATTVVSPRPDPDKPDTIVRSGFLGVSPTVALQRQGLGYVVTTMGQGTWSTLQTIGQIPQKLYHVARAALGLEKRDPNSLMSVVGAGRVAGEIASAHQLTVADRLFSLVLLLAGLNLFLGLINLLPLPPFDGAGIATTLYEQARRALARWRGRPDPGGVDSAKLLPVTYVMAALILVMSVILVYADIVAPVPLS